MCLKHGLQICLQCAQRFFWIWKADLYPGLLLQPFCLLPFLSVLVSPHSTGFCAVTLTSPVLMTILTPFKSNVHFLAFQKDRLK